MSASFFSKYKSFLKASEEHARSQEAATVLRDFIASVGDNDDAADILQALETEHTKHRLRADALMPSFIRETEKLDQPE